MVAGSLSTSLSQLLVAYIIEFDNEFEHRFPHTTARGPAAKSRRGPWLVSMAMWTNFMRYLPWGGLRLGTVDGLAKMTNLAGLVRWGYIEVAPDPADVRAKPPRLEWIVRPKPGGLSAQRAWQPIAEIVDNRWRERFGRASVDELREVLDEGSANRPAGLPDLLPVVSFNDGMRTTLPAPIAVPPVFDESSVSIAVLLARVLLALTIDFEGQSPLSLPLCANVIRVIETDPIPMRELPRRGGVSTEAIQASMTYLARHGYVEVEPAARGQQVRLTERGRAVRDEYPELLRDAEDRRLSRLGLTRRSLLRMQLARFLSATVGDTSALAAGMRPYPEGWRANSPYASETARLLADPPTALPHHPMILHRGGFPDGS